MSNDKGRDWIVELEKTPAQRSQLMVAVLNLNDDAALCAICNWAESIVKKELASGANRLPRSGYYGDYVKIEDVLSLLTDKGKEQ